MWYAQLKLAAALVLGIALVVGGAVHFLAPSNAGEQPKADQQRPPTRPDDSKPANWKLAGASQFAFSPDGKVLASGFYQKDNAVHLWDAATGKRIRSFDGHTEPNAALAFSPTGKVLASAGWDKTVRLWDVQTGRELARIDLDPAASTKIAFSGNGKLLAVASKTIWLCDGTTGKRVREFVALGLPKHEFKLGVPTEACEAVAVSADERLVATAHSWGCQVPDPTGKDRNLTESYQEICFWNAADGKLVLRVPHMPVLALAFAPDGFALATTNANRTSLLEVATGKARHLTHHGDYFAANAASLAFSADGRLLAASSAEGSVRVWNVKSGDQVRHFKHHHGYAPLFAFTPAGSLLAAASDFQSIRAWEFDLKTGEAKPRGE